ncbi:MAG: serine/threonine-protein kinase [Dehalococcoidia bacterium]
MSSDRRAIGRYTIRESLGTGGFAVVYRAYDPVLDREVALKVLHPHLSDEADTRERFIHEGRTLAGIHHPNIVQVYDAGTTDGFVYLAMELIEGRSLATLMQERGRFSVQQAISIAEQAAAALDALHDRGLVHCDVKPANIMLEPTSGRAVLLDFGVSRRVDDTVTRAGWIWGTPAYMAPEQIAPGQRLSRQTDVYQLAATIYALLTAEPPFTGEPAQLVYAIVHQEPVNLASLRSDITQPFAASVAQAMAKNPFERPSRPGVLTRRLIGQAATDTSLIPSRDSIRHIQTPPERGPSPWSAGARLHPAADDGLTTPLLKATTERLNHLKPDVAHAAPASIRRGQSRRTAVLGGALAAIILAGTAGIAWVGYSRGRVEPEAGPDSSMAAAIQSQTPSSTAVPSRTPSPSPSPRATATASPTPSPTPVRLMPTPSRRPGSVAADGASGLLQLTILRQGYLPSGPVVPVPLGRNAVMYVQRGDGSDGQRLFIFINDRFIGTDWEDASPEGVSNARAVGTGRFAADYEQDDGPPVTVVFTLTEDGLEPNAVAPGHCEPGRRC